MGRIRFFANPEASDVKSFTLADPDGTIDPATGQVTVEEHWVELRTELSDREWADLDMGVVQRATTDGELIIDLSGAQYHYMATWIKRWSLSSTAGVPVKPTETQIGTLLPAHAAIIWEIVKAHAAKMKEGRDASTNPTAASAPSPPTTASQNGASSNGASEPTEATPSTMTLLEPGDS